MQHIVISLSWWLCLLHATSIMTVAGCSDRHVEQASHAGHVQLALRSTSPSGIPYRLRYGTFEITGRATSSVSAEDNLQADAIELDLPTGDYSITLGSGWVLESGTSDGNFAVVDAQLTSPNPQAFTIEASKTSSVGFRFWVNGGAVEFSSGNLDITIEVDDTTISAGGSGGSGGEGGTLGIGGAGEGGMAGHAGYTSTSGTTSPCSPNTAMAISAGAGHACAVLRDGKVQCWGSNGWGNLGVGSTASSVLPVTLGLSNAMAISVGPYHSCAIYDGGSLACWGYSRFGTFLENTGADGVSGLRTLPVGEVGGITDAIAVTVGVVHTCVILASRAVQCWGYSRMLGVDNPGVYYSSSPITMSSIGSAMAISAQDNYTCALLRDSSVRCWGDYAEGASQNGVTDQKIAVMPSGVTHAIAVSAGARHSCVVLFSGGVECWGHNEFGQLGNGSKTDSATPVVVPNITNAIAISAGRSYTCTLLSDGSVRCWGQNNRGQLGNGTTTDSLVPVAVSNITNVAAISTRSDATCALLTGGSIQCWGYNGSGELGNGTTIDGLVPTSVYGFSCP